jgi:hypothetical protein
LSPEEFDNEVSQLELNLDRLRALYEQYFLGIERIEPAVARKTVDRQFWNLKRITMRNTARRFRFQTLVQRYNTLQQHWMKVCRQIENGTYPRHVKRAKQRGETELTLKKPTLDGRSKDEAIADSPELTTGATPVQATDEQPRRNQTNGELLRGNRGTPTSEPHPSSSRPSRRISLRPISEDDAEKIKSTIPPAPPAKAVPPPLKREGKNKMTGQTPAAAHNITDERVGGLYQELQRVRRRLNQDEADISFEALSRSLRATEARLKAKYAGKRIDFRVEIFNGKAIIKPTVKK